MQEARASAEATKGPCLWLRFELGLNLVFLDPSLELYVAQVIEIPFQKLVFSEP